MFDHRYHFISLVAVFLALGLGVLLGGALGGDDTLVAQQQELASRLEQEFKNLRLESARVRQEAEGYRQAAATYEEFARQVFPLLVGGRLEGKRVAVLDTGEDGLEAVQALQAAGALVERITLASNWNYPPQAELAGLARELGLASVRNERELWAVLVDCLANLMTGKEENEQLERLAGHRLLNISGSGADPPEAVVLVGSTGRLEAVRLLDVPLLRRLKTAGLVVVGAQRRPGSESPIPEYQRAGIPTVDNLESVAGQVSLIWSLAGEPGDYGVQETAARLLPDWRGLPDETGEVKAIGKGGDR